MGARGATGLVLTVGSEVFEESGRSLVRGTLDYLQGLKVCPIQCLQINLKDTHLCMHVPLFQA